MKCSLKGKQFSSRTNHPLIGWFSTWKTWFSKKLVLGLKYSMMKNKCIRVLKTSGKHWFTSCWPSQGSASPLLLLCIYDSNDFFFFFGKMCAKGAPAGNEIWTGSWMAMKKFCESDNEKHWFGPSESLTHFMPLVFFYTTFSNVFWA